MCGYDNVSQEDLVQSLADTGETLVALRSSQMREQERCFHIMNGLTVVRLASGTRGTPLAPNAAGQCLERCPK
jgi:hypothetical protein